MIRNNTDSILKSIQILYFQNKTISVTVEVCMAKQKAGTHIFLPPGGNFENKFQVSQLWYSYIIGNFITFTSFIGQLQLEINIITFEKLLNITTP